jgi:excisionase family DNA binding protein
MTTRLEKLLSKEEAAELLGVSPRTLEDWRLHGTGPKGIRVGRRLRYRPADIERWLDAQARAG